MDEARPSFPEYLASVLPRSNETTGQGVALDLFAGCGGMALGFEASGFETVGYEMDSDAVETYRRNLSGDCRLVRLEADSAFEAAPDLIIAGPPCQPFSVGGVQQGLKDSRDGFPILLSAVARTRPPLVIFENVRGMLYRNRSYLEEIMQALGELGYRVERRLLNAFHYGVPQRRERLVCVAHLGGWQWPRKREHLSFNVGEALGSLAHHVDEETKFLTPSMDRYIAKYEKASQCVRPRDLRLDEPSRTVTCRNLAGATGDMLRILLPDGRRKRISVREGARLQSFPDWFEFSGNEGSRFKQIGNAVPPLMSKALAESAVAYFRGTKPDHGWIGSPVLQESLFA